MDSPHLYILTIIQSQSILQSTGQVPSNPFENFFLTVLTHIDFPLFQIYYILINITFFTLHVLSHLLPKTIQKGRNILAMVYEWPKDINLLTFIQLFTVFTPQTATI